MKPELKERLDGLLNKNVRIEGKEVNVKRYNQNGGNILIVTNKRTFVCDINKINDYLDEIIPLGGDINGAVVSKTESEKDQGNVVSFQASSENKKVKDALLNALTLVQNKPNQVNTQMAKNVCDIANTMVNIQKVELQAIQVLNK